MSEAVAVVLAPEVDPIGRPMDWDKAVSAAYFRLLGASQKVAARAANVGERSLRSWEACSWWPEAVREANERWRTNLSAESRRSLLRAVAKDGDLALKALERLDPRMSSKELTVGWVQGRLAETVAAIRQDVPDELAEPLLARLREIWER